MFIEIAVAGGILIAITAIVLKHRETMEKIRQGIDPGKED